MPKPSLMAIGVIIVVSALALIGIAPSLGIEHPEPLAACVLGIGCAIMGLDAIVTGQMSQRVSSWSVTVYGLIARLRGGMMVLGGLGISLMGLIELGGPGSFEAFIARPLGQGLAMIIFGLLGLLFGAAWLLGRERIVNAQALSLLISLPVRIAGLVIILVSIGLIGLGALRIVAPDTLRSLFDGLLRSLAAPAV